MNTSLPKLTYKEIDEIFDLIPMYRYKILTRYDHIDGSSWSDIWDISLGGFIIEGNDYVNRRLKANLYGHLDMEIKRMNEEYSNYILEVYWYVTGR